MTEEPISLGRARSLIAGAAPGPRPEPVPLASCLGRTAAAAIDAREPVPPFENSSMDGYAVRTSDLAGATTENPVQLRVAAESRAGHPAAQGPGEGEAVKISTGAVMPEGADAVVPIEAVGRLGDGERIELAAPVAGGEWVRSRGSDVAAGDRIVEAGDRLGPAELGSLATVGADPVSCAVRPDLALISTGDELREPHEELGPGAIRNSNGYSLPAMAELAGARVSLNQTAADDFEQTREVLERALDSDLVVVCGGVSVGEHDHVKAALAELGAEQLFWRVAVKPGKPVWFGLGPERSPSSGAPAGESARGASSGSDSRSSDSSGRSRGGEPSGSKSPWRRPLIFGLPGNPVSAMVTFHLFVRSAIHLMLGRTPPVARRAILADAYRSAPGRAELIRCSLSPGPDGWQAHLTRPDQSSHVLTSALGADALALIPAGQEHVAAGETVEVDLLDR